MIELNRYVRKIFVVCDTHKINMEFKFQEYFGNLEVKLIDVKEMKKDG